MIVFKIIHAFGVTSYVHLTAPSLFPFDVLNGIFLDVTGPYCPALNRSCPICFHAELDGCLNLFQSSQISMCLISQVNSNNWVNDATL